MGIAGNECTPLERLRPKPFCDRRRQVDLRAVLRLILGAFGIVGGSFGLGWDWGQGTACVLINLALLLIGSGQDRLETIMSLVKPIAKYRLDGTRGT